MRTPTVNRVKYGFGGLMGLARIASAIHANHCRAVVVMTIDENERLKALEGELHSQSKLLLFSSPKRQAPGE